MTEQTCSKCDDDIDRPHRENGNYVISDDFVEPKEKEVHYALYHTDETWDKVDELDEKIEHKSRRAIAAEIADPDAPETISVPTDSKRRYEMADGDVVENYIEEEIEYSFPTEKFDHGRVSDPDVARKDSQAAYVYTVIEEVPVQKTGVVCPQCTADDDEIIWGVDK